MQRAVSLVLVFVCLLTLPALSLAALDVYFLDVGQGDASLILCDGESMLIDGGPPAASRFIYSILTRDLKLQRLDHLIATHPHSDHVGGLSAALSACQPGLVYSPVYYFNDPVFLRFRELVLQRMCNFTMPLPGQSLSLGGARVTFLAPSKLFGDMNDNSICLRVSHGSIDTLFTGDAGIRQEEDMIKDGQPLEAEILQSGHHGSSKSNGYKLLDAADPEYTVISCEAGNDYGHPHRETLKRLESKGVQVYRTDTQGTIVARSDGSSLQFETVSKDSMEALESEYEQQPFIANMNSGTYHSPTCEGLPKKENRIYFRTAKDARAAGYEPCGVCEP